MPRTANERCCIVLMVREELRVWTTCPHPEGFSLMGAARIVRRLHMVILLETFQQSSDSVHRALAV